MDGPSVSMILGGGGGPADQENVEGGRGVGTLSRGEGKATPHPQEDRLGAQCVYIYPPTQNYSKNPISPFFDPGQPYAVALFWPPFFGLRAEDLDVHLNIKKGNFVSP